ncbi:MAG: hypothetical protein VB137_08930 [Burkholderia sp.]
MGHLCPSLAGLHVAIEGKTVRGNAGRSRHPLHLVSAKPMKAVEMSRLVHTHWGIEK